MYVKMRLFFFLVVFAQTTLASSDKITPEDKENIVRQTGGSVYFECKNSTPFSMDCHVNCGNGKRFRKASGYCFYLSEGSYTLSVRTRYRNKNLLHTANVNVVNKAQFRAMQIEKVSSQAHISRNELHNNPELFPPHVVQERKLPLPKSDIVTTTIINNNSIDNSISQSLQDISLDVVRSQERDQLSGQINNDALNINNQILNRQANALDNTTGQAVQFGNNVFDNDAINNNNLQNNNQNNFGR